MESKYTCLLLVLICTRLPTSSGKAFFEKTIDFPQNVRPARNIQTDGKVELGNKENDPTVDSRLKSYSQNEESCLAQNKILVSGKCYPLLKTGPCGKDEWLVMDNSIQEVENHNAICKTKPCPKNYEVWWPTLAKCISKSEAELKFCNDTAKIIKINVFGEAMCVCNENFVQIGSDDKCYEYYQKGPCGDNEVITYDTQTGKAICSIDKCFQENTESFKKSSTERDLHSVQQYDSDKTQMKNSDESDTINSKRQVVKETTERKEKSYAPLRGDGPCHKLGSASICNDYGVHSRYVVNRISHTPECSTSLFQLQIVNPPVLCNLNSKGNCAQSIVIQKSSRKFPWMNR